MWWWASAERPRVEISFGVAQRSAAVCVCVVGGRCFVWVFICGVFSFSPIALTGPTAQAHSLTNESFKSDSDERKIVDESSLCFFVSLTKPSSIFFHFLVFGSHSRISMPLPGPVFLYFCAKIIILAFSSCFASLAAAGGGAVCRYHLHGKSSDIREKH